MTAIEETYQDVEKLVYKMAGDHVRRYGGDFAEVLSDAHVGFMVAYEKFDASRAQFTTCCYWYVRKYLFEGYNKPYGSTLKKTEFYRSIRLTDCLELQEVADCPSFDLNALKNELGEDARVVLQLTIDLPRVPNPTKLQRGLLQHLRKQLGWTVARCIETFGEIRRAL